jgi:hypothetical protein
MALPLTEQLTTEHIEPQGSLLLATVGVMVHVVAAAGLPQAAPHRVLLSDVSDHVDTQSPGLCALQALDAVRCF